MELQIILPSLESQTFSLEFSIFLIRGVFFCSICIFYFFPFFGFGLILLDLFLLSLYFSSFNVFFFVTAKKKMNGACNH